MKKMLKREKRELYYYKNDKKIMGVHSKLWGNVSKLWGNVSKLWGNVSGLWGNVSGLRGDIDLCGITEEERKAGIKIEDLIITDIK